MRSGTAKDALLAIRWKEGRKDWRGVQVRIRHRGAPDDEKVLDGARITATGHSFFEVDGETQIPYHRILAITRGAEVLYERGKSSAKRP